MRSYFTGGRRRGDAGAFLLGLQPLPRSVYTPNCRTPPPSLAFKAFSAQDPISFSLLINKCALAAVS